MVLVNHLEDRWNILLRSNKHALIAIPYIKGSFDASVDGGGRRAEDIWGHEGVGW